jgi:hypothetical protein
MSKPSPCYQCQERFTACHDHCPKDARGDYGHKAWKADMDAEKQALKQQNDTGWTNASLSRKAAYKRMHSAGSYKDY